MLEAYIYDGLRTPFGRHAGALSRVRPDDLLAGVVKEVVARSGFAPESVDDVAVGCASQAGEDSRNVARHALLLAGLPVETPGAVHNRLCGSGLNALAGAAHAITCGEANVCIAGGVESMTRAPFSMAKPSEAFGRTPPEIYDTTLGWRYPNARMQARFDLISMGETAENVATKFGISREEQDAFALGSHQKAVAAWERGLFARELAPVEVPQPKGPPAVFDRDESPRPDASLEALAKLKPAFREGGTVTPGNSSPLNDGASAVLLASEAVVKELGIEPKLRWVGSATAGVDPSYMGEGPIPATKKLLARTGLRAPNLDFIELNEAFASQAIACIRGLDLDPERVNVRGGGIALGHPIGSSGARIVATLASIMADNPKARVGLAALCIGVGQGVAALFDKS